MLEIIFIFRNVPFRPLPVTHLLLPVLVAANNVFGLHVLNTEGLALRAGLCAAKLLYGFNSLQLEGDSN